MKKLITIFLISVAAVSCSRNTAKEEAWEGFSNDIMRVIISEYFPPDETDEYKIPQQLIKERCEQRSSLLLACYINMKLPRSAANHQTDELFNRLISESIAAVKTVSSTCDENNHCYVVTEYNIAEINRELEKLK